MRIGPTLSLLALAFTVCAAAQEQIPQATQRPHLTPPTALQNQRDQGIADSILNGHYAIVFSGYKNGAPIIMAGSFIAAGAGHLTSGVLDVNDGVVQQGDRLYGIAYVVSPTKVVLLPTTNAPALGVFASAPSN